METVFFQEIYCKNLDQFKLTDGFRKKIQNWKLTAFLTGHPKIWNFPGKS